MVFSQPPTQLLAIIISDGDNAADNPSSNCATIVYPLPDPFLSKYKVLSEVEKTTDSGFKLFPPLKTGEDAGVPSKGVSITKKFSNFDNRS